MRGRDGTRRVPRRLPVAGRAGAGQQRLHQRDGRLDAHPRARMRRGAARPAPRGAAGPARRSAGRSWSAGSTSAARCGCAGTTRTILSQFEGYERLEEFPWPDYLARYGDISRLDRILEAEGDSPNRYKLSKQADVLMLFYLLSADELAADPRAPRVPLRRRADPAQPSTTTAPHLARVDAVEGRALLGAGPPRPPAAWELLPARRSTVTSPTCRAARRGRASTSARWPAPSTCCSGRSPGWRPATMRCGWTRACPTTCTAWRFRLHYREHHGVEVTVTHDRLVVSGRPRGDTAYAPACSGRGLPHRRRRRGGGCPRRR